MSLKKNIFTNYASQIYVTLIGIALVPLYVQHMGAEAYGLVGFFAMLQSWFNLLDLGLSPTIARESARYQGGAITALNYRRLFRALSSFFLILAVIGAGILWMMSDELAIHWLKSDALKHSDLVFSIEIMAISVALRWMGGLYRGVVSGAERLVLLSSFNSLIATLRFVGVLASMSLWGFTPRIFFFHQMIVAIIELCGLAYMAYLQLPRANALNEEIGWSLTPISKVIKFSLTSAFTSLIWTLTSQSDKLILSGVLPLSEYGYFTVAMMVASSITLCSGPISSAIMPRMTYLNTIGSEEELINTYRRSTRLMVVITGSLALTLAFCAEPLLYAWTGNKEISIHSSSILRLYAIGNGILTVAAFPYYLQYAKGILKYHLVNNIILGLVFTPAIYYSATFYGAIGAGWAWLTINLIYLLTAATYVHIKLSKNLYKVWLLKDVILTITPALIVNLLIFQLNFLPKDRYDALFFTLFTAILSIILTSITLPNIKNILSSAGNFFKLN